MEKEEGSSVQKEIKCAKVNSIIFPEIEKALDKCIEDDGNRYIQKKI